MINSRMRDVWSSTIAEPATLIAARPSVTRVEPISAMMPSITTRAALTLLVCLSSRKRGKK